MPNIVQSPQGMAYGWWHFERPLVENLEFQVEMKTGDERIPARYFQLYQGQIGGIGMYFGFQTDIAAPGKGGQGKGLIFSRWETSNSADTRVALGGWLENSNEGGSFVGVRSLFNWKPSRYVCRLFVESEDAEGVWYTFSVHGCGDEISVSAGSLRFPKKNGQKPLIQSGGGSWTGAYSFSGKTDTESVPQTHFIVHRLTANFGSLRPISCDTAYNDKFPNAECFVTPHGALHLISGEEVVRNHLPMTYALDEI